MEKSEIVKKFNRVYADRNQSLSSRMTAKAGLIELRKLQSEKTDRIEVHGCDSWGLLAIVGSIDAAKTEIARLKADDCLVDGHALKYDIFVNGDFSERM